MGFFGAAHGWRGPKKAPFPKICHTYPALMKLGTVIPSPQEIQKIYELRRFGPPILNRVNPCDAWLSKFTCRVLLNSCFASCFQTLKLYFPMWYFEALLRLCFCTFSSMYFSTYQLSLTFSVKRSFSFSLG